MARATRANLGGNTDVDEEGLNEDGEEVEEEEDSEGVEDGSGEDEEEDDDDDDDDDEDDEDEEDNEVPLQASLAFGREKRATMGKRMGGLVGEELDKDETFWGDGKWNIDDAESEYSNESESGDEVDSDFSASEDEAGAEGEDAEDEETERNLTTREKRQQQQETGARSKYKEPKRKVRLPPSSAALAAAAAEAALLASMTPEEVKKLKEERKSVARLRREAAALLLAPLDRSKRATTQQKTVATQEALAKMAKEEARKTVVKVPRVSKCIFTQEEMLIEACKTEQENARWLLARKRMQNESDTTAHAPKRQVKLVARFISRRGAYTVINFPEVDLMPAILKGGEGGREGRRKCLRTEDGSGADVRKCVITGLPARYLDPLTRQPYANREAFKALRADSRYMPQEEDEEENEGMEVVDNEEEGGMKEGLRKGRSRSSSLTNESFG